MPRATYNHTTPELRQVRFVRATPPVAVTLHQPVAPGEVRAIAGRVLGETHVDGRLHHYRVAADDGVVMLAPPEWLAPDCRYLVVMAGLTIPEYMRSGMWVTAIEELTRRWADPEGVA